MFLLKKKQENKSILINIQIYEETSIGLTREEST